MAKATKPKDADKDKPPARKRRIKTPIDHVLGKPEVMETSAFDEAKEKMKLIGKDFDDVLKRTIKSLATKHKVTEAMVSTAISHHLMITAVENAMSVIVAEHDNATDG
ncbi:MAG: hypothetical protein DI628_02490 [Blastochloris viridis]|uniref:Uncharacterized protein n=1 Tax=Blastochloris viridis TaxID=1079 RepID=A0A6N4RDX5_BLAVI|nr:MAG: hypothetical protein DI628_02490 [Blastochloris viridis]